MMMVVTLVHIFITCEAGKGTMLLNGFSQDTLDVTGYAAQGSAPGRVSIHAYTMSQAVPCCFLGGINCRS